MTLTLADELAKVPPLKAGLLSLDDVAASLEALGCEPRWSSDGALSARCPVHQDTRPSLSVAEGEDGKVLAYCHRCLVDEAPEDWTPRFFRVIRSRAGKPGQLPKLGSPGAKPRQYEDVRNVCAYIYLDPDGKPLARLYRSEVTDRSTGVIDRRIRWQRARPWLIGDGCTWDYGLPDGGLDAVPLWLEGQVRSLIAQGDAVLYLTEGESDAHAAGLLGHVHATCAPGGAGKFQPRHAEGLAGAALVVVVADHDPAGLADAAKRAAMVSEVIGPDRVCLVRPPVPGHDLRDLLNKGGTVDDLEDWQPPTTDGAAAGPVDSSPVDTGAVPAMDPAEAVWTARPVLAHVRDFARSRMASPWAVLGVALARAAVSVPEWVALPALVGGPGSLNLFVALVGRSGGGKGAAEAAARDALDLGDIFEATPGSGEGIAHAYRHRDKRSGELVWDRTSVLFSFPEIDHMTALGGRQSSTVMPLLRQGWSGEPLGQVTADVSRRILLPRHSYRMGLLIGVQPDNARPLLNDQGGGTPQRFTWLPVGDPDAPDETPVEPPPFPVARPTWKRPKGSELFVIEVPDTVAAGIRDNRKAGLRELTEALDGHAVFNRLKIAAALMVLDGRKALSEEDWHLAGLVMAKSDQTRAGVVQHLAATTRQENLALGHAEGVRAAVAQVTADEHAEKRVSRRLLHLLHEHGATGRAEARKWFAHRDRQHFDPVLERLVTAGRVTVEETQHGERLVPEDAR